MKTQYRLPDELIALMIEKNIDTNNQVKVCQILQQLDVQYVVIKPKEDISQEKPLATPAEIKHDGIVIVKHTEKDVIALYQKNDDFRELIKSLGFTWDFSRSCWYLRISERTGTAENIMAETGNLLLKSGFTVRFETQEILDKAVNGDFEPMTQRWVGYKDGYFYIMWERNDSLYRKIMTLPNTKYSKGSVQVPERFLDAILDFADQYDFKITSKAQGRISELQATDYRVNPKKAEKTVKESVKISENEGVLEDLLDE